MKKYIAILISVILICLFATIFLFLYFNNKNDDSNLIYNKVEAELNYYDEELLNILCKLNNISFSNYIVTTKEIESLVNNQNTVKTAEDSNTNKLNNSKNTEKVIVSEMIENSFLNTNINDINWEQLLIIAEKIYFSWNTIELDLYKINIDSSKILSFGNNINNLLINIKNQNKPNALYNIIQLYEDFTIFKNRIKTDVSSVNILNAKNNIFKSYYYVSMENWNEALNYINIAEQNFLLVMNNNESSENMDKIYICIKDIQNVISYKNKELYFLKFKTYIEEMNTIT